MAGVLTFAITLMIMLFTETPAFAGSEYNIDTTDVAKLQSRLSSVATVSGSAISVSEDIITITLINDVNGIILFEGQQGTTFILDASGHTINGSGRNEAVQLTNGNNATVILKGNGTYQSGINHTVYVGGSGKLIIESGTFNALTAKYTIISSSMFFELAEGYDYYTVTTDSGNLFASHNRKEKDRYGIPLDAGQLVVSQCYGVVPTYNIESLTTSNGSFNVTVNSVVANSAKVDDTVTVAFNPEPNNRYSSLTVKRKDLDKNHFSSSGGSGVSRDFDMPDSDVSIEVSFVWHNQITTQPTPENPTVVTNNPDGVSSYQWYTTSIVDYQLVYGPAGTGEVLADYVLDGNYDPISKSWSSNSDLYIYYYGFRTGDQLIISEITGNVTYCNGTLQADGSYIMTNPLYEVRVSFGDPGGSCKITLRRTVEVAIEGQTSDTYKGPRGYVYAKVNYTNGNELVSNTITYEDIYQPTPIPTPTPAWTPAPTPIPILEGKVEMTRQQDDGAPAGDVINSSEELKLRVLTSQEQEMVARGENAKIILKVTDINTRVSDEEKKLIWDKLAEEHEVVVNGDTDISVLYVDLSLYKQIGNLELTKVSETKGKISISIEVPEEFWNTDITKSREFYVLRIHDGEVIRIEGIYDAQTHLFNFETDRFSTYALTYQDTIRIQTYHDFRHLQLKAKSGKTSISLSYKRIVKADGYLIYGGKCGGEMTKLAELPAKITSYVDENLKKGTYYKYQVKAYQIIDGEQIIIMTSKVVHSITEGNKYGNPIKVTSDSTKVNLEAGKSIPMTCQVVLPKDKKLKEHTLAIRYESTNKEVATVNSKGNITAKAKGSCYVYAYAQNGMCKRIKVTVD